MAHYDTLVIGAGFAGAVTAGELARRGGRNVLVLERRDHLGGNAYDCLDAHGVLIHQYGPHIFHTADRRVYDYLSQYTAWTGYQHKVVASIPGPEGRMELPVPFNLVSLEAAFGPDKAKALEEKLIAAYGAEKKVTILELRQSPDPEIAALAEYVYDHVFVRYTMKQWGQKPEEIDPNTTARVPVFLSRDCRYFQDPYQGMPPRATPPFSSAFWTIPTSRWSWGRTPPPASPWATSSCWTGSPSPERSSTPAPPTSSSAAASAACPTAPWTSGSRLTTGISIRATAR